jgi:hypothetical protein
MKICNLHDLINAVQYAEKAFILEVWWRGQSDDWPLLSGIHRPSLCPEEKQDRCEKDLTRRFLLGARTRHSHWPEGDYVLQLAMMQHYRLPTRLLDWTESPLFALFFAVQNSDDRSGVLWALCPAKLNEKDFQTATLLSPYREDVQILFKSPFVDSSDDDMDKVAAVPIRHIDIRMTVQLSVFSIHGSRVPLNEYKGNDQFLIKFEIPPESKQSLRLELIALGIRESNIFPDLDHLADEMKKMVKNGLI